LRDSSATSPHQRAFLEISLIRKDWAAATELHILDYCSIVVGSESRVVEGSRVNAS